MAKKSAGPKEAAMRKQREGSAAPEIELSEDVQAEIKAMEDKQRAAFERDLAASKGRMVEIATLKAERTVHQRAYNDARDAINTIEKKLARLEGRDAVTSPHAAGGSGEKRTRTSSDDMKAFQAAAYGQIKSSGKDGIGRGDVAKAIGCTPTQAGTCIAKLKEAKKIKQIGELKDAKYVEA